MTTSSYDQMINKNDSESSSSLTAVNEQGSLAAAGAAANVVVASYLFQKYRETKSENTLERHDYDFMLFSEYLTVVGVTPSEKEFQLDPSAWNGMTWGIIEGFIAWQVKMGYSIASTNARLSTVKTYARLAVKADAIDRHEGMLMDTVKGYSRNEGINLDEKREVTRVGNKKAHSVSINDNQAAALKEKHSDTPASRRNHLIMSLLLNHGLRASEIVTLTKVSFDLEEQTLTFWRKKTKEWTTHELTPTTYKTAVYYEHLMPEDGLIFSGSRKDGQLTDGKLNRITISRLVQRLGVDAGFYWVKMMQTRGGKERAKKVGTLSAHDCRHYCATDMAKRGYSIKKLMDWFGWTSPSMAMRYVESAEVQVRNLG